MANFAKSAMHDGVNSTPHSKDLLVWTSEVFTTGEINTAVISELGAFRRKTLFIDITGTCTGGVSAPYTLAIYGKSNQAGFWTALSGLGSFTNTAYMRTLDFQGGGGFSGYPVHIEQLKMVMTNPNTGTGGGANSATSVTGGVNLHISMTDL